MRNLRVLKNLLKAEWLKEIKENEPEKPKASRLLEWQIKSKKYYVKDKYITLPEIYQK